jgi:thiamine biosynthesis protein ThiS
MVKINGKYEPADNMNLSLYLKENNYNIHHIAVEINEEIVSKSDFDNIFFKADDVVEIVSFVAGG